MFTLSQDRRHYTTKSTQLTSKVRQIIVSESLAWLLEPRPPATPVVAKQSGTTDICHSCLGPGRRRSCTLVLTGRPFRTGSFPPPRLESNDQYSSSGWTMTDLSLGELSDLVFWHETDSELSRDKAGFFGIGGLATYLVNSCRSNEWPASPFPTRKT